jgi:hypothetical protein
MQENAEPREIYTGLQPLPSYRVEDAEPHSDTGIQTWGPKLGSAAEALRKFRRRLIAPRKTAYELTMEQQATRDDAYREQLRVHLKRIHRPTKLARRRATRTSRRANRG